MPDYLPACSHPLSMLDRSDTQFAATEIRCKCTRCGNYVPVREKTDLEVATGLAPVAGVLLAAGGLVAALWGSDKQRQANELKAKWTETQCPQCQNRVVPTKIIQRPKPTLLSKMNFMSNVEQNYRGCPQCETAISFCPQCGCVTVSSLELEWAPGWSKTGYKNLQKCGVCKSVM